MVLSCMTPQEGLACGSLTSRSLTSKNDSKGYTREARPWKLSPGGLLANGFTVELRVEGSIPRY